MGATVGAAADSPFQVPRGRRPPRRRPGGVLAGAPAKGARLWHHAGAPCKGRAAPLQSRSPPDPAFSIRKLRPVKARVHVTLKPGILDPQGKAIQHALAALGFAGVEAVRQGKVIELELAESDAATARESLREMCEKLLANTVIENYTIELDAASDGSDAPSERGAAMNRSVEPG